MAESEDDGKGDVAARAAAWRATGALGAEPKHQAAQRMRRLVDHDARAEREKGAAPLLPGVKATRSVSECACVSNIRSNNPKTDRTRRDDETR